MNRYQLDPVVVERHCRCGWVEIQAGTTVSEAEVIVNGYVLHDRALDCPLHSNDARFDLPEGL